MSSQDANYAADNVNEGGNSDSSEGFPFVESNLYSDAYLHPQESKTEQVEPVNLRAEVTSNPVQNWEGNAGAQQTSCDAYLRCNNPETPSYVDSNNPGYFGGGPERVAQRPMSEAELYQQQRLRRSELQNQRANSWQTQPRSERYVPGGWDQGRQPVQNDGQTIVNISKGGQQGNNYGNRWNGGGWNNQGNQGNQGGDSTTIVTSGGQDVSTGSDDIAYGDFGHSKSRTEVGGNIVAGNGNGSGIDNPTYNDQTARMLGLGKVAERIGSVIRGNDRGGDQNNNRYGNRYGSNGNYDVGSNGRYYGGNGRQTDRGGRNTTIIVNGRGDVSTGSDDISYGDFEYGKQRTEVGTPPFFPNGQRGTGHRGSRSGIDNPTYNDETARWLGLGKVLERNIGAWKK